jgi:hypothetical protein
MTSWKSGYQVIRRQCLLSYIFMECRWGECVDVFVTDRNRARPRPSIARTVPPEPDKLEQTDKEDKRADVLSARPFTEQVRDLKHALAFADRRRPANCWRSGPAQRAPPGGAVINQIIRGGRTVVMLVVWLQLAQAFGIISAAGPCATARKSTTRRRGVMLSALAVGLAAGVSVWRAGGLRRCSSSRCCGSSVRSRPKATGSSH